jgi:hypothetical protein
LTLADLRERYPLRISGGEGDDALYGDAGNNVLEGNGGNDRLEGGADRVEFGEGVTAEQLWFKREGDALEVFLIGTDDRISLEGWFAREAQRVEESRTEDGRELSAEDVTTLLAAMADYPQPAEAPLFLDYPEERLTELLEIIGSIWELPPDGGM